MHASLAFSPLPAPGAYTTQDELDIETYWQLYYEAHGKFPHVAESLDEAAADALRQEGGMLANPPGWSWAYPEAPTSKKGKGKGKGKGSGDGGDGSADSDEGAAKPSFRALDSIVMRGLRADGWTVPGGGK